MANGLVMWRFDDTVYTLQIAGWFIVFATSYGESLRVIAIMFIAFIMLLRLRIFTV